MTAFPAATKATMTTRLGVRAVDAHRLGSRIVRLLVRRDAGLICSYVVADQKATNFVGGATQALIKRGLTV